MNDTVKNDLYVSWLEAQLERACKVIKPFVDAADGAIDEFDGDDSAVWEHPVAQNIHIKDFRAARAWMEQNERPTP